VVSAGATVAIVAAVAWLATSGHGVLAEGGPAEASGLVPAPDGGGRR
jgi:hypothetical protein